MPYSYKISQRWKTGILEWVAWIVLLPFILIQRPRKAVKKILLVEPFQMGDVLSLTPLIDPLLTKFPKAQITVLTKQSSGSILQFDSRITQVLALDFTWSGYGVKNNKLASVWGVLKNIVKFRKDEFDIGIDTRGDIRSQILLVLIGCHTRLGYKKYLHSNIVLSGLLLTNALLTSNHMHRYKWNVELLSLLEIKQSDLFPIKFPVYKPDRLSIVIPAASSYVLVHVGGGWEFKRWREEKWASLIDHLTLSTNFEIVVVGGPSEGEILTRVETLITQRNKIRFITTTLDELVVLVRDCLRFIGLDSGPMNLAVCLNKPVVSLFGPGDSTMWYPLNQGSRMIHKKEKFPCNPCFQKVCYFPQSNCMDEIEVKELVNLITS